MADSTDTNVLQKVEKDITDNMTKNSLSIRVILVVVALILPLNIYALYSAVRSQEVIIEQTVNSMHNIANIYMNDIEVKMMTINNFILELEERDKNLEDIARAQYWDNYYISAMGLRDTLDTHIAVYDDADLYFYYSEAMEHGMLVEDAQNVSKARLEEYFFADVESYYDRRWRIVTIDGSKWLFHVNPWKGMFIGAAIQLDQLEAEIVTNLEYTTATAYVDHEAGIESDDRMLSVTCQCGKKDIYLHIQFERGEVISNLPMLQKVGQWLAVLELLIIPIMLWVIRHLVLNPLKTLNSAVSRLKMDPDVRIESKASTEDFDYVYRNFNSMADELVELKIDNYEQRLERQRVEFRNLQLQIKPHFLFNSLNLMYNLVQMKEYKNVQIMLLYFADYFRYINVGTSDFSLFKDELNLIRKYLEVAAIRYPDLIQTNIMIDIEEEQVWVPQLMVHNFVENFAKHGLDLAKVNHLLLKAYMEDEKVVICIQDDGVGMPKELAENINQGIFEYPDGKNHLGLKNSYQRIRNLYGEQGSMRIESETGRGTKVILKFPAKPVENGEGGEQHEFTDRQ